MEGTSLLVALTKVTVLLASSMTYARLASSSIRSGPVRLLALLPAVILLPLLPWYFSSSAILRGSSAFFFVWLATFKLLLLSFGLGPLSPSLPLPTFLAISSLPLKLRSPGSPPPASSSGLLLPSAAKLSLLLALTPLYQPTKERLHPYFSLAMFGVLIYLALDLLLASSAFLAGSLLGLEVEPQFDAPFKSTSLRDFWGRRWNLMVTGILRPSVYLPVRRRCGTACGVVATFLVSGLMHKVIFFYYTLAAPTGELSCFFMLHGVSTVVEVGARKRGWWWPHPALALMSTLGFVTATGLWLFLPPIVRTDADVRTAEEAAAALRLLGEGGRSVISMAHSVGASFTQCKHR